MERKVFIYPFLDGGNGEGGLAGVVPREDRPTGVANLRLDNVSTFLQEVQKALYERDQVGSPEPVC
jgi:hypothetical protein